MPKAAGQSLSLPEKSNYEAELHRAKMASQQPPQSAKAQSPEQNNAEASFATGSGDDYQIGAPDFAIDSEESSGDESDFSAGYNSAAGNGSFLRERLVSWGAGIFSPPGTGPFFGSGASLMQWIFRDEIDSSMGNDKE